MKLYDYAKIIRSKNAGPFTLTIDLMFDSSEKFTNTFDFLNRNKAAIAELYNMRKENVKVYPFPNANTVKVSLPRPISSGNLKDIDVYGSQQHLPLGALEIRC